MTEVIKSAEPVDTLFHPDGLLVLYDERLVALGPIGAAVYELAVTGTTLEELTASLVAMFGEPHEGAALDATRDVVATLRGDGVLLPPTFEAD